MAMFNKNDAINESSTVDYQARVSIDFRLAKFNKEITGFDKQAKLISHFENWPFFRENLNGIVKQINDAYRCSPVEFFHV